MAEIANGFPLERLNELREHPEDFKVLERIPWTREWFMASLPVQLNQPLPSDQTGEAVFLDTETTGTDPTQDRIIELGMVKVSYSFNRRLILSIESIYDEFEDPQMHIPEVVTQLTSITDDMVAGQVLDQDQVAAWMGYTGQKKPLVIAHNALFDRRIFERRFGALDKFSWACSMKGINWEALGSRAYGLENLLQSRGWFYAAHRAYRDCLALVWLMFIEPEAFRMLIEGALKTTYKVLARGPKNVTYAIKGELKRRGYKWKADGREVWSIECDSPEEAEKYLGELYGIYREADQARIEECNAANRFK